MKYLAFLLLFFAIFVSNAQYFELTDGNQFHLKTTKQEERIIPAFSFRLNEKAYSSNELAVENDFPVEIEVNPRHDGNYTIHIINVSNDTLDISNVVPFGENDSLTYVTATGPWALARARLFRPGYVPVSITLPDNNWDLGYASFRMTNGEYVGALTKRAKAENARKRRYKTILYPRGSIGYNLFIETGGKDWQDMLTKIFREKKLYCLDYFDHSLYERKDLQWIKNAYLIILQFAWDKEFYDWKKKEYKFESYIHTPQYVGWYDIFGIWPTWPRLGADERNQWDLYEDLPGGLKKLRSFASYAREQNTKFFIAYNPWDKSTRKENPYQAMASLINDINADGVVLDTRGKSSYELQRAADSVKEGVVMYSEGMAVVEDMPGIISGRVHDAIYLQPQINMNKIIKPDFSIFRVCQLNDGNIHRETAISFFNGYGTEINTFAPGRPEWVDREYAYLGKTLMILRQNSSLFKSNGLKPLIDTNADSIWVNQWQNNEKALFTILSFSPDGYDGILFNTSITSEQHFVDLWNHVELSYEMENGLTGVNISIDKYPDTFTGTREEGEIACIARFQKHLQINYKNDSLKLVADKGNKVLIWQGNPSYDKQALVINKSSFQIFLYDSIEDYEGKVVVQLFNNNEIIDERIINRNLRDHPVLISKTERTSYDKKHKKNMVLIPETDFIFYSTPHSQFIPYPDNADSAILHMKSFYIDQYPVTNKEYYEFIRSGIYLPDDTTNYLKHWKNGKYKAEDANKPVTYISYDDAKAYTAWKGKRLPTEAEWQFAAQGLDGRTWPWGNNYDSTACYNSYTEIPEIGKCKKNISINDVNDMTGTVWQMTNDIYDNGSYYFNIIRGGSYYNPTSSIWYIKGGPQPLNKRQMLLLVSPGYDRCSTIGFRCAMDTPTR